MIEIGSRVKYIREDTEFDKERGWYPPIGTHGTVKEIYEEDIRVQWDYGTRDDGLWFCGHTDVEEIYNPTANGNIVAIRIYLKDGHIPMADLAFANKDMVTIEWTSAVERKFYAPYINGYTLIYDTRPKVSFAEWTKES